MINGTDHPYGFGGKEEQDELGLNWIDITARNYDPALGRWMNVDPLAEQMPSWSSYNYAFSNPVMYTDPTGMAPEMPLNDYGIDKNGKITLLKITKDKTDRLIADNGDVIASNVKKRILSDNINIAKNGLDIDGDLKMNFHVGNFLEKVSLYEQKEISWGFYANNLGDEGEINILPYENNKIDEAQPLHSSTFKGDKKLSLAIGNHTHPGLFGKLPNGNWDSNAGGSANPSRGDRIYGSNSKYGNLLWSRYGLRYFDSSGPKGTSKHPHGYLRNYYNSGTIRDRSYLKNVLQWKKSFNTPPQ